MPEPLHVVANLAEGLALRNPIMLDGLLAWAVAAERPHVAPLSGEPLPSIEIPVELAPGSKFHLCSEGFPDAGESELRHKHRRPPVQEFARLGAEKTRRVDISVSVDKSLRIPYQWTTCRRIEWWCVGDAEPIRALLSRVHYLGRFRGSGKGRLDIHREPWRVEPCAPWPGFPLVRDGLPMRPLPPDWPGLEGPPLAYRVMTFPYWQHHSAELCAVPGHH